MRLRLLFVEVFLNFSWKPQLLTQAPSKHLRHQYNRPDDLALPEKIPKYQFRSSISVIFPFSYAMIFRVLCSFVLWNREEKKISCYRQNIQIYPKKINLNLGDEFNARKWFPALRALCLSTLQRYHLNHDFQFSELSVRKLLKVRHGERPWEGHSPAGTVIFLQGNYMRVRRGG